METVVNKQLQNHLLNKKLISSRQFGFRPHHSTADLLTILAQTWNASLNRSEEVCIVACDIKGAFDRVWHKRSSCQTEIKRSVRYASHMVAELSS